MIRRANIQDLGELARLFDLYRQFYGQASDVSAARAFLQARMDTQETVVLVAQVPAGLAGFTQLFPSFSSVRMVRTWILNDLFVDPSHRQGGLGEALLRAAEAFSRESGAHGLSLQTAKTNATAQRLYERLGWKRDEKFFTFTLR